MERYKKCGVEIEIECECVYSYKFCTASNKGIPIGLLCNHVSALECSAKYIIAIAVH